jgi:hypothetical protein
MSDVLTHCHAGAVSGQHSTKPGFKAWGISLIALGLVAGAVIVGPQLLASPVAPAAPAAPPSVAVSVPVQRDVAGRLEFLGQFSAVQSVELRAQVAAAPSPRSASRMATSSTRATSCSRSTPPPTRSS